MEFYSFPEDLHITEVREVIKRHNERTGTRAFIEAERGDHHIFNYLVAFEHSFPTPDTCDPALNREYAILRECRGLIMCPTTGHVLARRYAKFFNLGERNETLPHNIDFSRPHVILEKLDGSMITPLRRSDGTLSWCTKMGVTDVATPIYDFVAQRAGYRPLAYRLLEEELTPLFEWCSRQQRIVIDYPEDQLVLTAVRDNHSGAYLSYGELVTLAARFNLPVVKALPGSIENIHEFMAKAHDLTGAEGYVIRFESGHMIKVKGAEYCQLHKTKEMLQYEKDVWGLVLHDKLDDAKAFMDAPDRDRVEQFANALEHEIAKTADRLNWTVIAGRDTTNDSKKRFAIEIVPSVPHIERGLLFSIWDGKSPVDVVKAHLKSNIATQTRVDGVRALVNGLNWSRYRTNVIDLDE